MTIKYIVFHKALNFLFLLSIDPLKNWYDEVQYFLVIFSDFLGIFIGFSSFFLLFFSFLELLIFSAFFGIFSVFLDFFGYPCLCVRGVF